MKVHIGEKIQEIYLDRGIKLSEFAERIGTVRQNIYRIFERETINSGLLHKISMTLDFDFFRFLSENIFIKTGSVTESPEIYKVMPSGINLPKELAACKGEVDSLRKQLKGKDIIIQTLVEKMDEKGEAGIR
ncbi:MAG: hypothetical protein A3H98_03750 [Bacteroidetes bacterium RIFCSPLOWO2_02_FULL_36_8]|nr:MAG: hypothetical protein A3H98_03750 [Bacteroidetes bacterium RIFCSPLOWO2_02_FULL_36_8]OFY70378.1 MAG: hypothetical protein A3G23_09635 [Bacteroidetes bacterium RIFCSPLOWO2_12_FULL_37_12]